MLHPPPLAARRMERTMFSRSSWRRSIAELVACAAAFGVTGATIAASTYREASSDLPRDASIGRLEQVHEFRGSMPTGVTVARGGRIFVNYPRWGDPVPFTVAE